VAEAMMASESQFADQRERHTLGVVGFRDCLKDNAGTGQRGFCLIVREQRDARHDGIDRSRVKTAELGDHVE
jgi:hypothetical protein